MSKQDAKYPPTPSILRCAGCGCDFPPTREQWVDFLRRGNEQIFCDRDCWKAWRAREKAKKLAAGLPTPDEKRARHNLHQKKWRDKVKAEKEARRKENEALAAKQRKLARQRIEALRRNMEESTRRNAPRVTGAKLGLGPATPLMEKRKCHTCGAPTWDYNCDNCKKVTTDDFCGDEYGAYASSAPGGIHR